MSMKNNRMIELLYKMSSILLNRDHVSKSCCTNVSEAMKELKQKLQQDRNKWEQTESDTINPQAYH